MHIIIEAEGNLPHADKKRACLTTKRLTATSSSTNKFPNDG